MGDPVNWNPVLVEVKGSLAHIMVKFIDADINFFLQILDPLLLGVLHFFIFVVEKGFHISWIIKT